MTNPDTTAHTPDWPHVQDYMGICGQCGVHYAGPKRAIAKAEGKT